MFLWVSKMAKLSEIASNRDEYVSVKIFVSSVIAITTLLRLHQRLAMRGANLYVIITVMANSIRHQIIAVQVKSLTTEYSVNSNHQQSPANCITCIISRHRSLICPKPFEVAAHNRPYLTGHTYFAG